MLSHTPLSSPLIATRPALEDLLSRLAGEPAVGLDTEFLRERTYRAELCLLQLTSPQGPICIDPLALGELNLMREFFSAKGPIKVFHSGRQDLEVLAPLVGQITPLFDTQIAAGLAGFPAQVGYAELVRRLFERDLPKAHTRTDWSQRPLSPEQIEYALDDVAYLLPMRERLLADLERLGRLPWLAEEFLAMQDPALLTVDPERAWLRFKGVQAWDTGRLELLQGLAAWRERRAIERNRPRGWILDDAVLREIALSVPRDSVQLAQVVQMPEGVVRHSGEELLALINAVKISNPPPPLPRREKPEPGFNALVRRLSDDVQLVAKELQLVAEVLTTRRDLEAIARGQSPTLVLGGWRGELLSARLLNLI